jgi:methylthioribulose-1-phosphate dehydratase
MTTPAFGGKRLTGMDARVAAESLIRVGRFCDARNFCPATSGNYSARLDATTLLVTASGKHKGQLGVNDFVVVDYDGRPVGAGVPSAETPLHALMFRLDSRIGAVIHTHSMATTVLGLTLAGETSLDLRGYEMLKAFPGITSHEVCVSIPIFDNTQDVPALAGEVQRRWTLGEFPGYVVRGHGLYAWGADVDVALRAAEALEFLVGCELEKRKVRP